MTASSWRLSKTKPAPVPAVEDDSQGFIRASANTPTIASLKGLCIVQKRQLLVLASNLCGRLTDKIFERSVEMSLIEVAGLFNGIENGGTAPQQVGRIPR